MKTNKHGFTMVELLVVLVIVAILAAVATPIYLANVNKSKASEAVAAMSLIRQSLRDYRTSGGNYYAVAGLAKSTSADGYIKNAPNATNKGVNVDVGTTKYFSNHAYSVTLQGALTAWTASVVSAETATAAVVGDPAAPVDFLIMADGDNTQTCTGADAGISCATNASEVANFKLMMDNSGRTVVSYDGGTTWQQY